MGVREETRDLRLQRACVYDLPERSVRREWQQIARDVEGASAQSALIRLLRHLGRLRYLSRQIARHLVGEMLVLRKEELQSLNVELAVLFTRELGNVEAALFEILISR